jgi:hypothetical protein
VDFSSVFMTGGWSLVPRDLATCAFADCHIDAQPLPGFVSREKEKIIFAAWTATVHGARIGWLGPPEQSSVPSQIYTTAGIDAIRDLAALRLWEAVGPSQFGRVHDGEARTYTPPSGLIETAAIRSVEARIRYFSQESTARSVLLQGEPGTGKTSLAYYLSQKLGYRTLVVDADDLCVSSIWSSNGSAQTLSTIETLMMMRPSAVVINDIDRLADEQQVSLLQLLDNIKDYASLIFCTTNHYRSLIEAIRRPGRLDDLIFVHGLSLDEVQAVAPSVPHLHQHMVGWPIAYVREVQTRVTVLGTAMAVPEFEDVKLRLAEIRKDGKFADTDDLVVPAEVTPEVCRPCKRTM